MVRQLICWLIFLVVLAVLLDGIVGEMDKFIAKVLEVEYFTAGPDVALAIPVAFDDAVDTGQEYIVADIELTIVIEKGFVDVGLNNIGKGFPVLMLLLGHALLNLTERRKLN
jgi:hypothetical protein